MLNADVHRQQGCMELQFELETCINDVHHGLILVFHKTNRDSYGGA